MAQPIETPIISYVTNGVTTTFAFDFTVLDRGDLTITLNNIPVTSGITVNGIGDPGGGNITFASAPTSGQTLVIARILPLKREDDYQNSGPWESGQVNRDFDRIWQVLQQMGIDTTRLIKLPIGTGIDQTINADAAERALNLVGFDAAGNVTVLVPTDLDLALVSIFMAGMLQVNDAAAARAYIGLSSVPSTGVANTWSKAQRGAIVTLTDGATVAMNMDDANNFAVTLAGNRTLGNPTNQVAGQGGSIFITQDATGSRTLAYASNWKFPGGTAPILSTAANTVDRLDYIVRSNGVIHATLTRDIK